MTIKDEILDVAKNQAIQSEKITNIELACVDIKHCLLGNGKPGLVVRTDRLEQNEKFRSKMFWFLMTIVFGIVAKMISEAMGFGG